MRKKLKASELMLKGFAMAGGRQCFGDTHIGSPRKPRAVCAIGAINLAGNGNANVCRSSSIADIRCFALFGCHLFELNDVGMSIPDIAGILAAEGM